MSDEPKLLLPSDGLLSKWGFNDGDAPADFLDWLEAGGHGWRIDWHPVLIRLVEDYLVPALDQQVTLAVIGTGHNPVRAETVNGTDAAGSWYRGNDADPHPQLTPEYVEVPFWVVLGVARQLGALGHD